MEIKALVLPHLRDLQPYSNARSEFKGKANIWLDANENPFNQEEKNGFNRYPDPQQLKLKGKLAELWEVERDQIFLGNGSDEAIDLILRLFCAPEKDVVMGLEPTYSMYRQVAAIHNVKYVEAYYHVDFKVDETAFLANIKAHQPKVLFICSPNNPSGNCIDQSIVEKACLSSSGVVVVDEAYIDFAPQFSVIDLLKKHKNLVILRTLSKAWGLAALRIGAAIADPQIIDYLNRIKPPYNINKFSQEYALKTLVEKQDGFEEEVEELNKERLRLEKKLSDLPFVEKVFPSQANFILIRVSKAADLYAYLSSSGIVVRNREKQVPGCLRVSVGTEEENDFLLDSLSTYNYRD
ncbi:MAG: histidinol-phosphate transaminase [Luteibaculum sp.]